MTNTIGKIHSIQTLGTLDGPGVRFVVFTQGCNLRCGCCHNPDTWEYVGGVEHTVEDLVNRALRCKTYFGKDGGVTLSGGEPLVQADFCRDFFAYARECGINTCLDTSGSILSDKTKEVLKYTDRVLLDIKYATDELYHSCVGCGIDTPLAFLDYLNEQGIPVTLRQVVIPTLNDDELHMNFLSKLKNEHKCVDKIELLGFKKICKIKYEKMGIPFDFDRYDTPTKSDIDKLYNMIK